ncbi:MAG: hypothetical protein KA419_03975 [Acidobacteria bacterium]|nr:hypothetical protein [Acidobacteriota bacterium]
MMTPRHSSIVSTPLGRPTPPGGSRPPRALRRCVATLLLLAALPPVLPRAGNPGAAGLAGVGPEGGWTLADRVAAVVGGTPVTLRQVVVTASLTRGRVVGPGEDELLRETALRLVEQEIILKEMAAGTEGLSISLPLENLRQTLTLQAGGEASLRFIRASLAIEDDEWNTFVLRTALLDEFVRNRFRPFVYVSQDDIRNYFEKEVLNGPVNEDRREELEQNRERIRQILEEIRVNDEFGRWLEARKKDLKAALLF